MKQGRAYIQYDGMLSLDEVIQKFKNDNAVTTNIFRFVGFILMLVGLSKIMAPLSVLLSFIPIFQKIVSALTFGLTFLISLALSLLIIAVAWLFYRPLLAFGLIIVIIVLGFLINKMVNKKI